MSSQRLWRKDRAHRSGEEVMMGERKRVMGPDQEQIGNVSQKKRRRKSGRVRKVVIVVVVYDVFSSSGMNYYFERRKPGAASKSRAKES